MTEEKQEQEREPVIVYMLDGEHRPGFRNGNNIAWMCVCGYEYPLSWSGFHRWKLPTVCPQCQRYYIGDSASQGKIPTKIEERQRG